MPMLERLYSLLKGTWWCSSQEISLKHPGIVASKAPRSILKHHQTPHFEILLKNPVQSVDVQEFSIFLAVYLKEDTCRQRLNHHCNSVLRSQGSALSPWKIFCSTEGKTIANHNCHCQGFLLSCKLDISVCSSPLSDWKFPSILVWLL